VTRPDESVGRGELQRWRRGPAGWPLARRVRAGATYGVLIGAVFSAFAVLNALMNGGVVRLRRSEIALGAVLIVYLVAGPATGALFGLLYPRMRRRWAAYLAGVGASMPVALASVWAVASEPADGLAVRAILGVAVLLLLGGPGGLIVREVAGPRTRRRKGKPRRPAG
jgi:MFS family permease